MHPSFSRQQHKGLLKASSYQQVHFLSVLKFQAIRHSGILCLLTGYFACSWDSTAHGIFCLLMGAYSWDSARSWDILPAHGTLLAHRIVCLLMVYLACS